MATIVLVIHLLVAVALVGVVLLQRSEGGALGIGGGNAGFMSGRSAGNALTKATVALAACFFATSIALSLFASQAAHGPKSIIDELAPSAPAEQSQTPAVPAPLGSSLQDGQTQQPAAPEAAAPVQDGPAPAVPAQTAPAQPAPSEGQVPAAPQAN